MTRRRPAARGLATPVRVVAFFLCALTLLASFGAAAAPRTAARELPPVEGEVIVRFKPEAATTRRHVLSARGEAGAVREVLAQRAAALGARHGRRLEAGLAIGERTQVVRAPAGSGLSAQQLAALLAADPEVESAEPNGRKRRLSAPNDPLYAAAAAGARPGGPDVGQWYLRAPTATVVSAIDIETAWARLGPSRGSAGVVVAVLDTGVRGEHPDLAGRLLPGYDMVSNPVIANDGNARDDDPSDPGDWVSSADINANRSTFSGCSPESSSWHGTTTTSLVAAATDNNLGMAGAAPGVRAFHVRVLGKCYGTDADIQAGMRWAGGLSVPGVPANPNPARVINMSLGGSGSCSAAYQQVVDELLAAGVVVVAAAGNSAGGPVGTPGNCNGVIAVAALRHAGSKVGFSDLGPQIAIAAPGGNCINITAGSPCLYPILGATNTGAQQPVSSSFSDSFDITVGTSFSSPLVAATAALMFSAQPQLSVAEMRQRMTATARPFPTTGADNGPDDPTPVTACRAPQTGVEQLQCYCVTGLCGAGMLDAGRAVTLAAGAVARITLGTTAPQAGTAVALSAAGSLAGSGRSITGWTWTVENAGGIVSGFSTATNAQTASITPTGAGSFTVALAVTDSAGVVDRTTQAITVAAAPVVQPPPPPPAAGGGGGGGGGGVMSAGWLAGLGLAVLLLGLGRQRAAPGR